MKKIQLLPIIDKAIRFGGYVAAFIAILEFAKATITALDGIKTTTNVDTSSNISEV